MVPRTSGVCLALFSGDTCMYDMNHRQGYVLRKLQRSLNSIETWCKRWNIKINVDKPRNVYI
jgi:hypothetical protein